MFSILRHKCVELLEMKYILSGKHLLVKLPPLWCNFFKEYYLNLTDFEILDCTGYIEQRCLQELDEETRKGIEKAISDYCDKRIEEINKIFETL